MDGLEERIAVDGEEISPAALEEGAERVRRASVVLPHPPSFFEATTAVALDRFRAENEVVLGAMPEGVRRAIAAVHPRGTLSLDGALDVYSAPAAAGGRPGRAVASVSRVEDIVGYPMDCFSERCGSPGGAPPSSGGPRDRMGSAMRPGDRDQSRRITPGSTQSIS